MSLIRLDPFATFDDLQNQMNNLFQDSLGHLGQLQIAPTTDVYKKGDKEIVAEVQLPNFSGDEISVDAHENVLEIRAEHHEKDEDNAERQYIVRESLNKFYRRIALPKEADANAIKAKFDSGVLKVHIPLKALSSPRKISIDSGNKKKK